MAINPEMYRAVVEQGEIVWKDADALPAPWWSLSKTAIASAALALVQRGALQIDSVLVGQRFTLRQLLQHTAGLADYGGLPEYHAAVASRLAPWLRQELFDRVEAQRLRSAPGERFAYSNVGYLIIRSLIEEATGLDLSGALEALVFRPLGLESVRVASQPADLSGSQWGNSAGYDPRWVFHGLVLGTPAQAALFLDRLLAGGLLSAEHLDAMRRPFVISGSGVPNRPWNTAAYGLGLMIDLQSPIGACYGHTGAGPGSTTATYFFADLPRTRTASVFAALEDQGVVERETITLAEQKHFPSEF